MKTALTILGVSILSLAASTRATAAATMSPLFTFPCVTYPYVVCADGEDPNSLVQASDGNFYGTAHDSAESANRPTGRGGKVFKITPAGQLTVLYTFQPNAAGHYPSGEDPGSLIEGPDGDLYGVASSGGAFTGFAVSQPGNIFKIGKSGSGFQIVHTFCSAPDCADGAIPATLILAGDGNFYGTTAGGGSFKGQSCTSFGCGTVFRLTPGGVFTVLHTVNGTTDGSSAGQLTQATDGNFYGPASFFNGAGAPIFGGIYRMTPGGQFTIIHNFPFPQTPVSPLVQAPNGLLYGAAINFASSGVASLFQISLSGDYQEIYQESSYCCKRPFNRVIIASDGNLWATNTGPVNEVDSLSLTGTLLQSVLFGSTDGSLPNSILQASDGKFYGTTQSGGVVSAKYTYGFGVIYSVDAGLPARK